MAKYPFYYKKIKALGFILLIVLGSMILMYLGISITKNIILLIDYFYPIQSTLTLEGNILYFKDYLFLQIKQLNLDQQLHLLKIL